MRSPVLAVPLVATALIGLISTVGRAQDAAKPIPDFRRGQWGAQFILDSPFVGAGALLFTSARSAWTLDGRFGFARTSRDTTNSHSVAVGVAVGRRWYKGHQSRVRPYYGVALTGSASDVRASSGVVVTEYGLGAVGELGATVFLTPNVSVGAAFPFSVGMGWSKVPLTLGGPRQTETRFSTQAGNLLMRGALYF